MSKPECPTSSPMSFFLPLSKWHHHSSHCSCPCFLILCIKPNSEFCWTHLWKRSRLQAFLPNSSASTLVQVPMTFHWDSVISTCPHLCFFTVSFPLHSSWSSIISLIKSCPCWKPPQGSPSHPNENQTPGLQAAVPRCSLTLHPWSHLHHPFLPH